MTSTDDEGRGEAYEQANVHDIYNKIAAHFSATRYKPWPVIDSFLRNLTPGSIGLDVGCGNGKYLNVRDDIYIIASDRSTELAKFAAQHHPHSTVVADCLSLPHPENYFDFAISIAVIHHLSTKGRRINAVQAVLQSLKLGNSESGHDAGCALFFVWALEQKTSRRGWDETSDQDQLVPWVLKDGQTLGKTASTEAREGEGGSIENTGLVTYHRFYHLYRQGELEDNIRAAGGEPVASGYDRDNWWCIARRLKHSPSQSH